MLPGSIPGTATVSGGCLREDKETQTDPTIGVDHSTQTPKKLSCNCKTPKKRLLKDPLECRKKNKLQKTENKTQNVENKTQEAENTTQKAENTTQKAETSKSIQLTD